MDADARERPAVVVTGAAGGIGTATVAALMHAGYRVFAGVHKTDDTERFALLEAVTSLPLDVTDAASIERAAAAVADALGASGRLAALVNNAGIAVTAPLAHVSVDEFRRQLDVNVTGALATVQAFLPLLRRARGRIVNVGSTSAHIVGPFNGAYCASKFALEALTRVLRLELRAHGIGVASVDPGPVATGLWDKIAAAEAELAARLESSDPECAAALRARRAKLERLRSTSTPPEAVAAAIVRAVGDPRPRKRYVVGLDAKLKVLLARTMPEEVIEGLRRAVDTPYAVRARK